jgi:hypothetical protein
MTWDPCNDVRLSGLQIRQPTNDRTETFSCQLNNIIEMVIIDAGPLDCRPRVHIRTKWLKWWAHGPGWTASSRNCRLAVYGSQPFSRRGWCPMSAGWPDEIQSCPRLGFAQPSNPMVCPGHSTENSSRRSRRNSWLILTTSPIHLPKRIQLPLKTLTFFNNWDVVGVFVPSSRP